MTSNLATNAEFDNKLSSNLATNSLMLTMTHNISELPGVKSRDEDPFTADSDLLRAFGAAVKVWPP